MSLSTIYQELHRRARESGEARGQTLAGGARITVRAHDGRTILTLARKNKPLSASEIETFKRDCGVPAEAHRRPEVNQNRMERDGVFWFYCSYTWSEGEDHVEGTDISPGSDP